MALYRPRLPAAIAALAVGLAALTAAADPPEVHVYKSPDCGCCTKWMDHLRAEGFAVRATDVPDVTPVKLENGVPLRLAACHTAIVGGYVVEGHVPAADIHRILRERPDIAGLAVPGMPIGSPGMEGPNPEPYQVLAFGARGVAVFAEHGQR
jgi:hypothetical protein